MNSSYGVYIWEKDGKRYLRFLGVDHGAPLEIVAESEKAVIVWQKGHSSYLNRMSGSKYFSPNYRGFLYTVPHKECRTYSGNETGDKGGFELEYTGRAKQVRLDAENKARAWFERANKGEFDALLTPRRFEPEPEVKTPSGNLGKVLWELIQSPQGYAFISDSVEGMTDREALQIAKAALRWEKTCVNLLTTFIERNKT